MLGILQIVIAHLVFGGLCANSLVILSLATTLITGEGSKVSPDRRYPQDSDAKLFGLLFAIGSGCGLLLAVVSGFQVSWLWLVPTGSLSLVVGSVFAYTRVVKLNEMYLERAMRNLEQGNYKEAIEDAGEVARSSERLRSEANAILSTARDERYSQPFEEAFPDSDTIATERYLQVVGSDADDDQ